MSDKSIRPILDQLLCCGCGACAGICPTNAITMLRNPAGFLHAELNAEQCIQCGKCSSVCPSFPDKPLELCQEPLLAVCGYAKDPAIRAAGQSGGVGTALLLHLLETKQVDAAVVTRLFRGKPETICTDDPTIIRTSAGSVYAQTAVVETVLKNRGKRLAVVALGCQARAIRKALQSEDIFIVGLICGGNMSLRMKDQLLKKMGVYDETTGQFRYRDKANTGWPGGASFQSPTELKTLEPVERMKLKPLYECYRCIVCPEKMNLSADIVLGDPWGITEAETDEGVSVALAYTETGRDLLELTAKNSIALREIRLEQVLDGQRITSDYQERLVQCASILKGGLPFETERDNEQPAATDVQARRLHHARRFYCEASEKELKRAEKKALTQKDHMLLEFLHRVKNGLR